MHDWLSNLPESARNYVEGHRLTEVECLVADLAGVARGKAMPARKFATQSHFHLPDSIFLQTITGDWVETSRDGTEPDMVLRPDLSTATAAPWASDRTLQVIHDIEDQNGAPVPVSHRGPRDGVLPGLQKHGSWSADRTAAGSFRTTCRRTTGLFDERSG